MDGEKRERKLIEKYIVSAGKPDRVIGHQATRTKGAESMNRISDGRKRKKAGSNTTSSEESLANRWNEMEEKMSSLEDKVEKWIDHPKTM